MTDQVPMGCFSTIVVHLDGYGCLLAIVFVPVSGVFFRQVCRLSMWVVFWWCWGSSAEVGGFALPPAAKKKKKKELSVSGGWRSALQWLHWTKSTRRDVPRLGRPGLDSAILPAVRHFGRYFENQ